MTLCSHPATPRPLRTTLTLSHEHHTFFFPDSEHGTANTAGFGCGVVAVSKRPLYFRVPPVVLAIISSFGERENLSVHRLNDVVEQI